MDSENAVYIERSLMHLRLSLLSYLLVFASLPLFRGGGQILLSDLSCLILISPLLG